MNIKDELLKAVDEGFISAEQLVLAFVKWNTAEDIEEMLKANELLPEDFDN